MEGRFFANPDSLIRVTFDDGPLAGEWIKLRERLSDHEEKTLVYGSLEGFRDGERGQVMVADLIGSDVKLVRQWVTRWSLEGDRERGTRPSQKALELLLPECVDQVLEAITKHIADIRRDREVAVSPKPDTSSSPERTETGSSMSVPGSYSTPSSEAVD